MNVISSIEAAKLWGISDRRVRLLCGEGRIMGAAKVGRNWMIPATASKPTDAREHKQKRYEGLDYDFHTIDLQKQMIDTNRPFSKNLAKSLHDKLVVEWTHHSNAIEGNTLTMSETKVVLEGITIGGKSIVEHLETINHRDAIGYIEDSISGGEALSDRKSVV